MKQPGLLPALCLGVLLTAGNATAQAEPPSQSDPGKHLIEVKTANGASKRQDDYARGKTRDVEKTVEDDSGAPAFRWSSLHISAITVGGIGAASLIAGSVTGGLVFAEKPTIDDRCDGAACDGTGKAAADKAQSLAAVSTATISAGAGCLAAATIMWLLAPSPEPAKDSARIQPFVNVGEHVAVGLAGTW